MAEGPRGPRRAIGGTNQEVLKAPNGVEEKRMFGGLCFMLNGHMCCGVEKDRLMVRVGRDRYETLLKKPHARELDFTGKPLKGFPLFIEGGYQTDSRLTRWLDEAVDCADSRTPKNANPISQRNPRRRVGLVL